VALSRSAPSGPRSLTPVVMQTSGLTCRPVETGRAAGLSADTRVRGGRAWRSGGRRRRASSARVCSEPERAAYGHVLQRQTWTNLHRCVVRCAQASCWGSYRHCDAGAPRVPCTSRLSGNIGGTSPAGPHTGILRSATWTSLHRRLVRYAQGSGRWAIASSRDGAC
jgi:hypothetical protein